MARKRRSYRKNPTRRRTTRRVVRRAARRARASIGGLNFKSALKDLIPAQIGMFASKYAVRRLGEGGTETDPSSWQAMHYVKGGIGALAAGFLANMVKPGTGQKVLEGGLNYVVFKLIENELISQSDWASGQFGYGENYNYRPGDVETNESGQPFLLGADNQWHALPESIGQLEPVGPLGQLEPVGPLGEDDNARYRNALLNA